MQDNLNPQREFIKWFYEEGYPNLNQNRAGVMKQGLNTQQINQLDFWMREAYLAGVRKAAADTVLTLGVFACAVEGLEPELLTPSQVFDRAQENLLHYYNHIGVLSDEAS